ncbi:CmpA/NrtA family ABC transporter substrate-binding protein [Caballeronia sp. Lep1P3]|uniref:CmpA/NrtA family ABC transporter substrate-binding protein n=1 Tax=Caballeronia sp. Lep1P3 TaxID=2878150 RepID=UPI001FD2422D|nr:CmpA/NrtA family ABC transporter substrate-binding protein [Caballeronia sp. Lep1P3]
MNSSDSPSSPAPTPERTHVRVGFVALSDAAPLAAAALRDLGRRHGITIELCRQSSWAAVRDKLLSGELDAAHALYGLVYGVQLGIGGPQADMAVLMVLNRNGQAITLSNALADAIERGASVKDALASLGRTPVIAQTFPTGTHAMWLYYWLAANGVHPLSDVRSVVIQPPRMADALVEGTLDGFCAGEPWHAVAHARGAGRTVVHTSEIWPDHPEKVLACRRDFVALYPTTARALVQTLLDACAWVDAREHRVEIAEALASPELLGVPRGLIEARLVATDGAPPVRFFDGGAVNYPRVSDGVWFITQYRRWGMLPAAPDAAAEAWREASAVNQAALYRQAAQASSVDVPDERRTATFCDARVWDGTDANAYLASFDIHA